MYDTIKKPSKGKIIEICILLVILLWILLFIINYMRYTKDKPPLLAFHITRKCDDGKLDQYYALGYVYRKYNSSSIRKSELVPFWVGASTCKETNGLPQTYKDYEIPENKEHLSNYRGLAYFYNGTKLIGAYKCLNSDGYCTRAVSGYDKYHMSDSDALTRVDDPEMVILFERYGFVDDSMTQNIEYGDKRYNRIIYYYDIVDNKILHVFSDVKFVKTKEDYNKKIYGDTDAKNRLIVKDKNLWGLLKFNEDGTFDKELDFEYTSINYDEDMNYYILEKDDTWSIYDIDNNKYILEGIASPIYDVWRDFNRTTYYKTGKTVNIQGEETVSYSIYNLKGQPFLNKPNITNVISESRFIMYIDRSDNTIHFLAYTGKEPEEPIQLYFYSFYKDNITHPCLEYKLGRTRSSITLKVYVGSDYNKGYETHNISTSSWYY